MKKLRRVTGVVAEAEAGAEPTASRRPGRRTTGATS